MHVASKKRILLAWYIDLLLFSVSWNLLSYFLNLQIHLPIWSQYACFVVIQVIALKTIGSAGHVFLGINLASGTVEPNTFQRESWLTILIGVLLILEGTKQMVKWTQFNMPIPAAGFHPHDFTQIAIHVAFGISAVTAGYWFLKLKIQGLYLGVFLCLFSMISNTLGWKLWNPVIANIITARRELQGRSFSDGGIEYMLQVMPEGRLIAVAVLIVAMLLTYKRFVKS